MKVKENTGNVSFFAYEGAQREEKDRPQKKNVFAGDMLPGMREKSLLEQKKEKARKDAMQAVKTQFGNDRAMDDDMAAREQKIAQCKADAAEYNAQEREYRDRREALAGQFGLSEEEKAQQDADIELLKKAKTMPVQALSDEERKRLASIGEGSEYQKAAMACDDQIAYYQGLKQEALDTVRQESQILGEMRKASVKNQGMIEAQALKEEMEQAASREIIGMLVEEGKEAQDQKAEESREEAEKAAEKKEEEERLAQKKEEEDQTDQVIRELPRLESVQEQIQEELQEIVEKNKLLQEDLKGIAVDQIV